MTATIIANGSNSRMNLRENEMAETKLNIYQKINEIRKQVDYIQKDKSVSTGGGSYKAVTHDQVTAILRKHMNDQGLICIPNLVKSFANDRVGDAKQFRYDATYSFEFVNADAPEEKVVITIEAHAMDNADKAPGKALSYAKKYAVLKLFEIETGESEESRYQQDEFNIELYLDMIKGTENMEDLRTIFAEAMGAANLAKDKESAKILIKAKDLRKLDISGKSK